MDGKPTQNSSRNFPQGDNIIYNTLIRSTVTYASETWVLNLLNAELNPICHLLALLGAHHILHVSRIRVKENMINKLMTFKRVIKRKIYGYTRKEDGYWRIKINHTKRTEYN